MSEYMEQAVSLLKNTSEQLNELVDKIAVNIEHEDHDKAHEAYLALAALDVYTSQISGEDKTVEGKCEINNVCAKVVIGGVSIRDRIQFEIKIDGKWYKGHRDNSQYGQVFYSHEDMANGHILTHDDDGRVIFPLQMDE